MTLSAYVIVLFSIIVNIFVVLHFFDHFINLVDALLYL